MDARPVDTGVSGLLFHFSNAVSVYLCLSVSLSLSLTHTQAHRVNVLLIECAVSTSLFLSLSRPPLLLKGNAAYTLRTHARTQTHINRLLSPHTPLLHNEPHPTRHKSLFPCVRREQGLFTSTRVIILEVKYAALTYLPACKDLEDVYAGLVLGSYVISVCLILD